MLYAIKFSFSCTQFSSLWSNITGLGTMSESLPFHLSTFLQILYLQCGGSLLRGTAWYCRSRAAPTAACLFQTPSSRLTGFKIDHFDSKSLLDFWTVFLQYCLQNDERRWEHLGRHLGVQKSLCEEGDTCVNVVDTSFEKMHPCWNKSWCFSQTLPKTQRTRGLSSAYQSKLLRSYHKMKYKSW